MDDTAASPYTPTDADIRAEVIETVRRFVAKEVIASTGVTGSDLKASGVTVPRLRYLVDGWRWENDWSADAYEPNAQHEPQLPWSLIGVQPP